MLIEWENSILSHLKFNFNILAMNLLDNCFLVLMYVKLPLVTTIKLIYSLYRNYLPNKSNKLFMLFVLF